MQAIMTLEGERSPILWDIVSIETKEDESKVHFGRWISPGYGPFLLGTCFETYKPFISVVFFQAMIYIYKTA